MRLGRRRQLAPDSPSRPARAPAAFAGRTGHEVLSLLNDVHLAVDDANGVSARLERASDAL